MGGENLPNKDVGTLCHMMIVSWVAFTCLQCIATLVATLSDSGDNSFINTLEETRKDSCGVGLS